MRINNNLMAMNTHRQLGMGQAAGSKSMEKLSSGYRINRAGDDAAGLAISEKMRGQIRGLNQASRNAQDGISLIQTAEGALGETHAILQRMRELAVQSANDTNASSDRGEIQKEMNQLTSEMNRIGNTTEFNTQKLLNGDKSGTATGTPAVPAVPAAAASGTATIATVDVTVTGQQVATPITIAFADGDTAASSAAWSGSTLTLTLQTNGTENYAEGAIQTLIDGAIAAAPTGYQTAGDLTFAFTGNIAAADLAAAPDISVTGGTPGSPEVPAGPAGTGGAVNLQIGSNQSQSFEISIGDMRASALGVAGGTGATAEGADTTSTVVGAVFVTTDGLSDVSVTGTPEYALDISNHTKASAAISVIDQAIETVSGERSKLGAFQNRLEHTIKNLDTSSENLQASESRIRDVDMAKEMMEFTKNNILTQAAQAMLAQANAAPQGVLQLLR